MLRPCVLPQLTETRAESWRISRSRHGHCSLMDMSSSSGNCSSPMLSMSPHILVQTRSSSRVTRRRIDLHGAVAGRGCPSFTCKIEDANGIECARSTTEHDSRHLHLVSPCLKQAYLRSRPAVKCSLMYWSRDISGRLWTVTGS